MTDHNEQTTTPELPPEVAAELIAEARRQPGGILPFANMHRIAYAAGVKDGAKGEYQRGADAELPPEVFADLLAEANRATKSSTEHGALLAELARLAYAALLSKPPSLKEQALSDLDSVRRLSVPQLDGSFDGDCILLSAEQAATIRRALESLPD